MLLSIQMNTIYSFAENKLRLDLRYTRSFDRLKNWRLFKTWDIDFQNRFLFACTGCVQLSMQYQV